MTALFIGASAQATIINEFTDLALWTTATTGQVTQTFTGSTLSNTTVAGLTLDSINYRGFYNETTTIGYDTLRYTPSGGSSDDIGSGGILRGGNSFGVGSNIPYDTGLFVNVNAIAGISALAFNYSGWRENNNSPFNRIYSTALNPIQLRLEVMGSSSTEIRTLTVPAGNPAAAFFGFTYGGTISGIRLLITAPTGTASNVVVLDNFAYAQIAEAAGGNEDPPSGGDIPEPSTYLLCSAGLLILGLTSRKRS